MCNESMGLLHISVTVRDIETKLFTESDDRTVLRPENMENVIFHSNSMEYNTGTSILQDRPKSLFNIMVVQSDTKKINKT